MAFDPTPYLTKLKGGQYLPVKDRLMWLREEHPEADIVTDLVRLDLDLQLAVFRAQVTVPGRGSATGYGSETERDFPAGWIEKAETKAVGRALAALGFGTQFALELDEGERVVDTPVQPRNRIERPMAAVAERPARAGGVPARSGLQVVGEGRAHELRNEVVAGLAADSDAAAKLPKRADEMSVEELEKTLVWLRNRARREA